MTIINPRSLTGGALSPHVAVLLKGELEQGTGHGSSYWKLGLFVELAMVAGCCVPSDVILTQGPLERLQQDLHYFRGDQFRSFMVGIEDASFDGQVVWHVKFVNVYVKLHESTDEGECWVHVALLSLLWRSHRSPQRRKLY
jgi:hypothetical protein